MASIVNYNGEWEFIDGIEDVILQSLNPEGETAESGKGLRGNVTWKDASVVANYGHSRADLVFVLWTATLGGLIPKHGDKIEDENGDVYTILVAEMNRNGSQYRCITTKDV